MLDVLFVCYNVVWLFGYFPGSGHWIRHAGSGFEVLEWLAMLLVTWPKQERLVRTAELSDPFLNH